MKRTLFLLAGSAILALLTVSRSTAQVDTAHFGMRHSYDVQKYTLELDLLSNYIAPYPKSFSAKEVITLKVDSALSYLYLHASELSLIIDSVGMPATGFTRFNDSLKINLNRVYQPGEIITFRIAYRHADIADNAFYVSGGFVYTDCPPEGARHWFPCWDKPSDKAYTDLTARVPFNVRLGATGRLADSVVTTGSISYHWVSDFPVATYLITLTSKTDWQIYKYLYMPPTAPCVEVPVMFYHKSDENTNLIGLILDSITDFYSLKFGNYPFEKIGFATLNSSFPWGGMENQTMVNLQQGGFYQEDLIAHEHSHQWFGDMITCGTWADIWLNEGFATYCEKLWWEYTDGYALYKSKMNSIANYYLTYNPGWPIYQPSWVFSTPPSGQLYSTAISYDKGACILFMLRYVLGDSVFFDAMNSYATDTNFIYKNAVTEDFVTSVSQTAGEDISWFFDEWVYSPNHPVYSNVYNWTDLGNGIWKVDFNTQQIQTNSGFFKMPIEIQVGFTDNSDTVFQVMNDANFQHFEFLVDKEPTSVTFDPGRMILLKQATTIVGIAENSSKGGYCLEQNEPNPFRSETRIRYRMAQSGPVSITVLDMAGKEIMKPIDSLNQASGSHELTLPGKTLRPGTYFFRMQAGAFSETKKMVVE